MNTGGWADKLGNRYEGLWTVKQLLLLLHGRLRSVQLESVNPEDESIDLFVTDLNGSCEAQQCKKNNGQNNWTIRTLAKAGVISALRNHLARDSRNRFSFISNREPTDLKRLVVLARQFSEKPHEFITNVSKQKSDWAPWEQLCETLGLPEDAGTGLELLLRTDVPLMDDGPNGRRDVETFAEMLLDGDRHDAVLRLADFALDRMGHPIHADELRRFINETTTFRIRDLAYSPQIATIIEQWRLEYHTSIRRTLIRGELISRPESGQLLAAITVGNGARIHCVHGKGGQGKSSVLYELGVMLHQRGILYLPLRFDQIRPRGNTRVYGQDLDFPESPVRCLHAILGERTGVLIIDQLDALRWTPQHDPTAWTVFERLVTEAMQLSETIHVVVACRTFDLEHEPQIRSWQKQESLQSLLSDLPVADLPSDVVKKIVEDTGALWSALTAAQQRILQVPQLLYLWTNIANNPPARTNFRTATDLMRAFWLDIRGRLANMGVSQADLESALSALVTRLDEDGTLTAPITALDRWPTVQQALGTLNVLEMGEKGIRFAHQSYFDYYLAELWRERLRKKGSSITEWLTAMDEQSFLRRGQLRQLLAVLRDDSPNRFADAVRDLLSIPSVRFHLKHLTLQFVGHIPDPSPAEVTFILEMLKDSGLRDPISSQVLCGHVAWFDAFDAQGVWKEWLLAEEPWKLQIASRVLHSVGEMRGDRIAQLLSPHAHRPDPWPNRIRNMLPWRADQDTRSLFELRVYLLKLGIPKHSENLFSDALAQREPRWLIDLFEILVSRFPQQQGKPEHEIPTREKFWPCWIPRHIFDVLRKVAEAAPDYFWEKLSGAVALVAESHRVDPRSWDRPVFELDDIWQVDLYKHEHTGARPLPELLALSGGLWARVNEGAAIQAVTSLSNHPCQTIQQLVATFWLHCPDGFADDAICWLIDDPRRFGLGRIGDSRKWHLAKDLLSRYSGLCSEAVYRRLELGILSYHPTEELEYFKKRLQAHRIGFSPIGSLQHALLPALPPQRRSPVVVNAIGQLQEKFKRSAEDIEGERDLKGGFVASPISARRTRLSDRAWLELIAAGGRPPVQQRRRRYRRDHFIESSPEMFASDLGVQAEHEPARFAALALRIPRDAPPIFWAALLHALRVTKAPGQAIDSWHPADDAQCCAVLRHVGYPTDPDVAVAFGHCVAARSDHAWHAEIIAILCKTASEHPHPQKDKEVISSDNDDRLNNEAINAARGCAAEALAAILFKTATLSAQIRGAIEHLVADPVPAIRVAAIKVVTPVLNIDREQAVAWFVEACTGTLDQVLSSHNTGWFLQHVIATHSRQLDPLLDRMERSNILGVAKQGASWSTLVWLHENRRQEAFEESVQGSIARRQGVASVLAAHVTKETVAAKCQLWLPRFFDDPEREVRVASTSFVNAHLNYQAPGMIALLRSYVASKAFLADPKALLWDLKDFNGDLRPLSQLIFEACDRFTDPAIATQEGSGDHWGSDIEELSVLLLRLYGQVEPPHDDPVLRKGCLDRWDNILRNENGSLPSAIRMLG